MLRRLLLTFTSAVETLRRALALDLLVDTAGGGGAREIPETTWWPATVQCEPRPWRRDR